MKKRKQWKNLKKYKLYGITVTGIILVYLLLMFIFTVMTVKTFQSRREPEILSKLSELQANVKMIYDEQTYYGSEKQESTSASDFYNLETKVKLDEALRKSVQECQWEMLSNQKAEGIAYALLNDRGEDIQVETDDCMIARDQEGNVKGYWCEEWLLDSQLMVYLTDPDGNYEYRGKMTDQALAEIMIMQNDELAGVVYDQSCVDENGRIRGKTTEVTLEFRIPYLKNEKVRKTWDKQGMVYYMGPYPEEEELPEEGYVWIERSGYNTLYMGQIFLTEENPENVLLEIGYIEPTWRMAFDYLKIMYLVGLIVVVFLLFFLGVAFSKISAAQERMERQQRDFINLMAHELKTPLAVTRVLAENLQEDINPDKRDYYLNGIVNQTDQMNQLVLELIGLIRLSSDDLQLKQEEVSFTEVIATAIFRLQPEADKKRITFSIQKIRDFTIIGDRDYLVRAISNILDNAVCYGREDSEIRIRMSGKICSICNQTEEEIDGTENYMAGTTVGERKHHGIGLTLCSRIFGLHGLTFSYEKKNGIFEVVITGNTSHSDGGKGVFMLEKTERTMATLINLREYTAAMHSMSASRSGMNLSSVATAWIGTFETEKDGRLELILTERQMEKMHIGMKGLVHYRNGKFVKIEN